MERSKGPDRSQDTPARPVSARKGRDERLDGGEGAPRDFNTSPVILPPFAPVPAAGSERQIPIQVGPEIEFGIDIDGLSSASERMHSLRTQRDHQKGVNNELLAVLKEIYPPLLDGTFYEQDYDKATAMVGRIHDAITKAEAAPILPAPRVEELNADTKGVLPPPAPEIEEYPWELNAGLSMPEVRLYKQVREECLSESGRSLVKDCFFADYGTIDPAENYWAALVEFPMDFDNFDPAFEGAVGAVVRGPSGNNYEVGSNTTGQVRLFGPMELEMERQRFLEWKEDRY